MAKKSTPWSVEEVTTFLHYIADDKIQRELDGATRNIKVFQEVSTLMSTSGYSRTAVQCREKLKKMKGEYRLVKDNNNTRGASRKNWKWFDLMDSIYGHRPSSVGREGGLDLATASLHDDDIGNSMKKPTTSRASTSSISTAQTPARPQTQTPTRAQTPTPSASSTPLGKRKRGGEELALLERQLAQQKEHQEQKLAQQKEHQEQNLAEQREDRALQKEDRALQAQYMNQTMVEAREARVLEAALRREEMAHAESFNVSFLRTLCQVLGGTGSQRAPSPPPL